MTVVMYRLSYRKETKMKKILKKVFFWIGLVVISLGISFGVSAAINMAISNHKIEELRERLDQVDYEIATEELQELKGEVNLIQDLCIKREFSTPEIQVQLLQELKDCIRVLERSNNKYLKGFSVSITETDLYYICDEVMSQINSWMDCKDNNGEVKVTSFF